MKNTKLWNRLPIFRKLMRARSNSVSSRKIKGSRRYISALPTLRLEAGSRIRILENFDLSDERRGELIQERDNILSILKTGIYW